MTKFILKDGMLMEQPSNEPKPVDYDGGVENPHFHAMLKQYYDSLKSFHASPSLIATGRTEFGEEELEVKEETVMDDFQDYYTKHVAYLKEKEDDLWSEVYKGILGILYYQGVIITSATAITHYLKSNFDLKRKP